MNRAVARETLRPRGLLLQWHLTDTCNLRCRHCYAGGEPASDPPLEQLEAWFNGLLDFLRRRGIPGHINFTGGEPLLREDFPRLLEMVQQHRETCTYAVLSNGSLVDETAARWLKRTGCRFVQISVDGAPETHDALRGPGSFSRCRAALRTLRRQGVVTMVSFTVSRANVHDFPEVANMASAEGAGSVWCDRLLPVGRGREMADRLLSAGEVDAFFQTMFRVGRQLQRRPFSRTRIRMHRALQFRTLQAHGIPAAPYRCNAGRGLLAVLPDGTVLPCRRMPIPVGRLGRDSLEEIYEEAPLLRALRSDDGIPLGCEACEWRHSCHGGLRCLSHACTGDIYRADPQCSLAARESVGVAEEERGFVS
jgi:radical SAM protein with 4Fe4S-binding SPASM domain